MTPLYNQKDFRNQCITIYVLGFIFSIGLMFVLDDIMKILSLTLLLESLICSIIWVQKMNATMTFMQSMINPSNQDCDVDKTLRIIQQIDRRIQSVAFNFYIVLQTASCYSYLNRDAEAYDLLISVDNNIKNHQLKYLYYRILTSTCANLGKIKEAKRYLCETQKMLESNAFSIVQLKQRELSNMNYLTSKIRYLNKEIAVVEYQTILLDYYKTLHIPAQRVLIMYNLYESYDADNPKRNICAAYILKHGNRFACRDEVEKEYPNGVTL